MMVVVACCVCGIEITVSAEVGEETGVPDHSLVPGQVQQARVRAVEMWGAHAAYGVGAGSQCPGVGAGGVAYTVEGVVRFLDPPVPASEAVTRGDVDAAATPPGLKALTEIARAYRRDIIGGMDWSGVDDADKQEMLGLIDLALSRAGCVCDAPGDGSCPLHWLEMLLQDELVRVKNLGHEHIQRAAALEAERDEARSAYAAEHAAFLRVCDERDQALAQSLAQSAVTAAAMTKRDEALKRAEVYESQAGALACNNTRLIGREIRLERELGEAQARVEELEADRSRGWDTEVGKEIDTRHRLHREYTQVLARIRDYAAALTAVPGQNQKAHDLTHGILALCDGPVVGGVGIETQETIAAWRRQIWSEPGSVRASIARAAEEMRELQAAGDDDIAAEAADVAIMLCDVATTMGFDLWGAVTAKMVINRGRDWDARKLKRQRQRDALELASGLLGKYEPSVAGGIVVESEGVHGMDGDHVVWAGGFFVTGWTWSGTPVVADVVALTGPMMCVMSGSPTWQSHSGTAWEMGR